METENPSELRSFGENLRAYLDERNWSPSDLIRATGLKQSTISDLLNGRTEYPRSDLINTIIRNTDANPDFLLTGKGSKRRIIPQHVVADYLNMMSEFQRAAVGLTVRLAKIEEKISETKLEMDKVRVHAEKAPSTGYEHALASLNRLLKELKNEREIHSMDLSKLKKIISEINDGVKHASEKTLSAPDYPINPEAIEVAYKLLFEAVQQAGGDIMSIDPNRFAGVLRIAVREVSRPGYSEEVRKYLIREAELILGLVKGQ